MAAVKVGGAGEESGGRPGEEVAGASEAVGGSVGKEIGGGSDDSDEEVEGGDDVSLDAILPLRWLPPRPFPPLPESRHPMLSTGAASASMGAP